MLTAVQLRVDDAGLTGGLPVDDASLARATLDGNPAAFDTLVRTHHRRVLNFIYQMTRQRQDAEDLTQQTFIKAHAHLASYDGRRPLINWLLTIARNNALNHFRGARSWTEIPEDTMETGPSPAQAAESRERTEGIWERARAVLSQREFEILWLRYAEELSIEETARLVGLTQTHVKVLVFRARRTLLKREEAS